MGFLENISDKAANLQNNAAAYFEVLYRTTFGFWLLPEIPAGGTILTGTFASVLLYFARFQMSQPTDISVMATLILALLLFLIFICGILVAFDPFVETRVENMKRLASVSCVGITLGAGFILMDRVLPWIGSVQGWANGQRQSDWLVAFFAALAAWSVICANTLYAIQPRFSAIKSGRVWVWSTMCLGIFLLGIGLVITPNGFFFS